MLPCVLYVTEAHDYLQRDFWVNIHGSLLDALRSGNLQYAETRSISNARVIREIMFKHSSHGPSDAASQLINADEFGFELPPQRPADIVQEAPIPQISQDVDPIHP